MAKKGKNMVSAQKDTPDYVVNLKRGCSVVLYDLQGGPISNTAVEKLSSFAEEVAKEFNLVHTVVVE